MCKSALRPNQIDSEIMSGQRETDDMIGFLYMMRIVAMFALYLIEELSREEGGDGGVVELAVFMEDV